MNVLALVIGGFAGFAAGFVSAALLGATKVEPPPRVWQPPRDRET